MERVSASAPSNIALIKYMGKSLANANLPANSSLSWTLEHLRTFVELERNVTGDRWELLPGYKPMSLSERGQKKFLQHLARMKDALQIAGTFTVRSANNFPSDCGLASSASSFAALTLAAAKLTPSPPMLTELSELSRLGSGSSCRSLFSPWALWRNEGAEPVADLPRDLEHAVILVDEAVKAVSSSEAHLRVASSAQFSGRPARAEERLLALTKALKQEAWREAMQICWDEFEDMHLLFETADPPFSYRNQGTFAVLERLREVWRKNGDGPLVTMDAGANVHLLLRREHCAQADGDWLRDLRAIRSWAT